MGALVPTSTTWHGGGDMLFVTAIFSAVTDGDTYATGLGSIDNVIVTCNTLGTPISFGVSWSAGTVTFDVSSNSKAFTITAIGR